MSTHQPQVTTIDRVWLRERIDAHFRGQTPDGPARIVAIVGGPGTGKTVLANQLSSAWNCCSYFIRFGSTDTVIWQDPRTFLVSLGLQLRARYGGEVFKDDRLAVRATVEADRVEPGGKLTGTKIGTVALSPFRRALVEVNVHVGELAGEVLGLHIQQLIDTTDRSLGRLAIEALTEPLERISKLLPEERVRIIVDSLDGSLEIAEVIPLLEDLPKNAEFVLTTRTAETLERFEANPSPGKFVKVELADPELKSLSARDVTQYCFATLAEPGLAELIQSAPIAVRPAADIANQIGTVSEGNFLYTHHLLDAIREEAKAKKFDLLTSPMEALPRGLDGIYRYFVTHRIRSGVSIRDWAELYVPVLGILAVSRAPLTSEQISRLVQVKLQYVDGLLGMIRSLLDRSDTQGNAAWQFYHRSFADFLLTQDRSRNHYPLEPAAAYHRKICRHYDNFDEKAWASSSDLYALMYLPQHALEGQDFGSLVRLLRGPFSARQIEVIGPNRTRAECLEGARAAAMSGFDGEFVLLLERGLRLDQEISSEWETGGYVLALLRDGREAIRNRVFRSNPAFLPWPAFLAAERLIDIFAFQEALEFLRRVESMPWPDFVPERAHGVNLTERCSSDFILDESVIGFLAKLAELDPPLALALTKRCFEDSSNLPNVRTAWRDVLEKFLEARLEDAPSRAQESAEQCRKLAETTCDWLRSGGIALGWAGVTQFLFELIARSTPAALDKPHWIANALLLSVDRRFDAKDTVVGAQDKAGLWGGLADALNGILDLWDALKRLAPKAEITGIVEKTWKKTIQKLPNPPVMETPRRNRRAEWIATIACALHRAGSKKWKAYGDSALSAARMDGVGGNPFNTSIAGGLTLLAHLEDRETAERARTTLAELGLQEAPSEHANRWKGIEEKVRRRTPEELLAAILEKSHPYARGRIALEIANRFGPSAISRIAESFAKAPPPQTRPKRKKTETEPAAFGDILSEALASVIAGSGAAFAHEALQRLHAMRSAKRREEVSIDESAFSLVRWRSLARQRAFGTLKEELEESFETAVDKDDVTRQLQCCLAAVEFDLDLASRFYSKLRERLVKVVDRGLAAEKMVAALHQHQPNRLVDLGARWAADLPGLDTTDTIHKYQVTLCREWGDIEGFRNVLIDHLHHIASFASKAFDERLAYVAEAAENQQWKHEEKVWRWLGELLEGVARVLIGEDTGLKAAAEQATGAILHCFNAANKSKAHWKGLTAARNMLDGLARVADSAQLVAGPALRVIRTLYVSPPSQESREHEGSLSILKTDFGYDRDVSLGLQLAALLKTADPDWSHARYAEALTFYKALLENRLIESDQLHGMATGMVEAMIAGIGGSLSHKERRLLDETRELAGWCVASPVSLDRIFDLQATLSALANRNLRFLLLAPVSCAWLALGNYDRALAAARIAGSASLSQANFHERLRARASTPMDEAQHLSFEPMVLDVLLSTSLKDGDALEELLVAWFTLVGEKDHGRLEKLVESSVAFSDEYGWAS